MNTKYNVSFIGSGNLATNLSLAFDGAGHDIQEVYSRQIANASALTEQLSNALPKIELDFSESKSSIFVIAIPDNAIQEITEKLKVPNDCIIVHTSGTTSLDVLSKLENKNQVGIFYPLQTFKKNNHIDFSKIPILFESASEKTNQLLKDLGKSISSEVKYVNSEDRKTIHLAAVFASNFTNRMLAASDEILRTKNISLELIKPLVIQSIENSFNTSPDESLTGPAKRNDLTTIKEHQKMLEHKPELRELYKLISNSILKN